MRNTFDDLNTFCHFLFNICFCLLSDLFQVALNQRQISMFSYEQAAAVTNEQYNILSEVQKTALSMALTPWENRPVDFRGKTSNTVT